MKKILRNMFVLLVFWNFGVEGAMKLPPMFQKIGEVGEL